jgi:hypothetical protein
MAAGSPGVVADFFEAANGRIRLDAVCGLDHRGECILFRGFEQVAKRRLGVGQRDEFARHVLFG